MTYYNITRDDNDIPDTRFRMQNAADKFFMTYGANYKPVHNPASILSCEHS